jgi:NADH:ubiquinone oxidoreductase subunit 3 (subunit A)
MRTMLVVGIFFLFLSTVFGLAARSERSKTAGAGPSPAGKARRNVSIAFAVVGLALLLLGMLA